MKKLLDKYLKSHGIAALTGLNLTAYTFVPICFLAGIFVLLCMRVFDISGVLLNSAGFICAVASPFIILNISNDADNDKMLTDIRNMFEMLKIQAHAGVYIVDAIENCEPKIRSVRLKKAIEQLISSIYMSKDMSQSLDDFNAAFDNRYIDTLVIIIKQSMESGYSTNQLDGGFEQILDMENAICIRTENSIERNTQILQVMFMAGIVAMTVFCSIVEFKGIFEIL